MSRVSIAPPWITRRAPRRFRQDGRAAARGIGRAARPVHRAGEAPGAFQPGRRCVVRTNLKSCLRAAVATAGLTGCLSPNIEYLGTMRDPPVLEPRPASTVEVLSSEPTHRPFVEVGVIV